MAILTKWGNTDKHVNDSQIKDSSRFINSGRTIIFVKPTNDTAAVFNPVGVVQGWSFSEQKQLEEIFELGSDIRYIVPGRTTGQLSITRMMIAGTDLLNALYKSTNGAEVSETNTIRSLKDINTPIDIVFATYANDGTPKYSRQFVGCHISARQESISANQVVIAENCAISYEQVKAITLASDATPTN